MELADRIAVMNHGRVEQVGSPREIYDHPASPFVFEFVGAANRFEATVEQGRVSVGGVPIGPARIQAPDGPVVLYSRPHQITPMAPSEHSGIPAVVQTATIVGPVQSVKARTSASTQMVEVEMRRDGGYVLLNPGTELRLRLDGFTLFRAGESRPMLHQAGDVPA